MNKNFKVVFVLAGISFIISFLMIGCNSSVEIPYNGVFYLDNKELIEIPVSIEYPYAVSENDPIIRDLSTLYLQWGNVSISDLILQSVNGGGNPEINVKVLEGDQAFEISPKSSLVDGDYCLVIGDITKTIAQLNRWCFKIGDPEALAATAEAIQEKFEELINVSPPGEGLFLIEDTDIIIEVPQIYPYTEFANENDHSEIPTVTSEKPVALLQSSWVDLANLHLYRARPLLGFDFDEGDSFPCIVKRSRNSLLQSGDTILSLDGVAISSCEESISYLYSLKPGAEVQVEFQRGTYIQTMPTIASSVYYDPPKTGRTFPFEYQLMGTHAVLYPTKDLLPGVYCYAVQNTSQAGGWVYESGFCFRKTEG